MKAEVTKYIVINTDTGEILQENGIYSKSLKRAMLYNTRREAEDEFFDNFEKAVKVKVAIEL